ncbi:ERF family protein [Paucidesulfovibrio longus]|uniref:ERF family protein n=1 Tax=Paucidesulfovibrio longus TaxID=889 RepID=UPI0003B6C6F6|nr:ERF family protein [Paucidesulfovibrio longus]
MQVQSFHSPEITNLAKAMLQVQQALPHAQKDRENPFTKSRYATLNSVMDTCREALLVQGVWVAQYPVPAETGHLGLVTKLVHAESGEWQSSMMVMPLPKADPQGYGSALTYARRYALSTLVGLVTEQDDDAQGAMPPKPQSKPAAPLQALPRLDGVQYQSVAAQDGRECITATGDTRNKREMLKQAGFRWDPERKVWWRYATNAA